LPKNEMSRGASSRSIIREHALISSTVVFPMAIPHAPEDFSGTWTSSVFNREYRRFFGQPPIRDIKALRDGKVVAITTA
jgi:hypothetical protein